MFLKFLLRGKASKITYKSVAVYIDKNSNLIAVPSGESDKYGMKDMNMAFELQSPYSDEELELFLLNALNKSFSQKADDTSISAIEQLLNVKGYAKAVKNRKLVIFEWLEDSGYFIIPTNNLLRRGFVHIENKKVVLGKSLQDGALAKTFRDTVQISTL